LPPSGGSASHGDGDEHEDEDEDEEEEDEDVPFAVSATLESASSISRVFSFACHASEAHRSDRVLPEPVLRGRECAWNDFVGVVVCLAGDGGKRVGKGVATKVVATYPSVTPKGRSVFAAARTVCSDRAVQFDSERSVLNVVARVFSLSANHLVQAAGREKERRRVGARRGTYEEASHERLLRRVRVRVREFDRHAADDDHLRHRSHVCIFRLL
jgi:hypothetical protein